MTNTVYLVTTSEHMSPWTHRICERCWFQPGQPGAVTDSTGMVTAYRYPLLLKVEEPEIGVCCYCRQPTVTRIYVRAAPMPMCTHTDEEE